MYALVRGPETEVVPRRRAEAGAQSACLYTYALARTLRTRKRFCTTGCNRKFKRPRTVYIGAYALSHACPGNVLRID